MRAGQDVTGLIWEIIIIRWSPGGRWRRRVVVDEEDRRAHKLRPLRIRASWASGVCGQGAVAGGSRNERCASLAQRSMVAVHAPFVA